MVFPLLIYGIWSFQFLEDANQNRREHGDLFKNKREVRSPRFTNVEVLSSSETG